MRSASQTKPLTAVQIARNLFDPGRVVEIPGDGLADALLKLCGRLPAKPVSEEPS